MKQEIKNDAGAGLKKLFVKPELQIFQIPTDDLIRTSGDMEGIINDADFALGSNENELY